MLVTEKRKQLFGEDHPDTLSSMGNLANTYRNKGRWNDAEELRGSVRDPSDKLGCQAM